MAPAAVRRLQSGLARLGNFHHVVTGVYGPVTTAAVKRFQRAAGLTPDGVWGPKSTAALTRRLRGH
jgi:peptidoglycan hydrolase-like protein with peptidoglycan-binding domain